MEGMAGYIRVKLKSDATAVNILSQDGCTPFDRTCCMEAVDENHARQDHTYSR